MTARRLSSACRRYAGAWGELEVVMVSEVTPVSAMVPQDVLPGKLRSKRYPGGFQVGHLDESQKEITAVFAALANLK